MNSPYNIHRNNFLKFVRPHEQEQTSVFWKWHILWQGLLCPACYLSDVGVYLEKSCSANPVACISPLCRAFSNITVFLKVLVGFRGFKLLKDGCFSRPHINTILLGLKNKTNTKDPDSASEILSTTEVLFHKEMMERQLFSHCVKQTKSAVSFLKYWHFN